MRGRDITGGLSGVLCEGAGLGMGGWEGALRISAHVSGPSRASRNRVWMGCLKQDVFGEHTGALLHWSFLKMAV